MLDRPGADRQRFDPALIPQDVQPAGVTGPGATDLALVNGHAAGLERMHAQQHAVRRRFRRRRGCRARVIAHDRPLRSHRTHRLAQRVSADPACKGGRDQLAFGAWSRRVCGSGLQMDTAAVWACAPARAAPGGRQLPSLTYPCMSRAAGRLMTAHGYAPAGLAILPIAAVTVSACRRWMLCDLVPVKLKEFFGERPAISRCQLTHLSPNALLPMTASGTGTVCPASSFFACAAAGMTDRSSAPAPRPKLRQTMEGYAKHPCLERLTCDDACDKPRSA